MGETLKRNDLVTGAVISCRDSRQDSQWDALPRESTRSSAFLV